jgi:hypothetical protein
MLLETVNASIYTGPDNSMAGLTPWTVLPEKLTVAAFGYSFVVYVTTPFQ